MSNFGNTNSIQVDTIVDRLNGTVAKVSKLRLSLEELEAELSDIRQQCENVIRPPIPVASVDQARISVNRNEDTDEPMTQSHHAKIPRSPVFLEGCSRNPDQSKIGTSRGKTGQPKEIQGETRPGLDLGSSFDSAMAREIPALSMKIQSKGHLTSPSRIPCLSSLRISEGQGSLADIAIEKGGNSLDPFSQPKTAVADADVQGGGILVPPHGHAENFPIAKQIRATRPPHPPTHPFPFPKRINLSSYPPGLKREGDGWFVLFNPSPKVKQVLEVNLLHDLSHGTWMNCVRFSQDGKWVATGGLRTAQIYDVTTGVVTCVFLHSRYVSILDVCFSPDGRYLATGSMGNNIRIWNIAENQFHSTVERHEGQISSLDFSPSGQYIVSVSDKGAVRIWDVHDGALKVLTIDDHYLPFEYHRIRSVAISPDGRYLAVGSEAMVVSILEVTAGVLVQRLTGHRDVVSSVEFTPDGKGLISGSWDSTLKYWDVSWLDIGSDASMTLTSTSSTSSSPCLMNLTSHHGRVNSIAVSHDGAWILSGSADGKVLFWNTRTGMAQHMLSTLNGTSVRQVGLSPMGNIFATVAWDGLARIWSYGMPG